MPQYITSLDQLKTAGNYSCSSSLSPLGSVSVISVYVYGNRGKQICHGIASYSELIRTWNGDAFTEWKEVAYAP